MAVDSSNNKPQQDFTPLAALLRPVAPELDRARQRLELVSRTRLIVGFRDAFTKGKRVLAYLIAEQLVERYVPPCFWHEQLEWDGASRNERYDLYVADLLWLRRWHRDHVNAVRYTRSKHLLTGWDSTFHQEAAYAFWEGRRKSWQLVRSLSLREGQQWECAWLRSTPIIRQAALIDSESQLAMDLLRADLSSVRRTVNFSEADAEATLRRRYALWRCWRMEGNSSPTAIAVRYQQLTGEVISRQLVAKHLGKIRSTLARKEMKVR